MFSGDVTGQNCLRLEDRIDEYVVVHNPFIPHAGLTARAAAAEPRKLPSYAICSMGSHAIVGQLGNKDRLSASIEF